MTKQITQTYFSVENYKDIVMASWWHINDDSLEILL